MGTFIGKELNMGTTLARSSRYIYSPYTLGPTPTRQQLDNIVFIL